MRVMVMVKATKKSETGALPTEQLLAEMGMLAGDGLRPSREGKRLRFPAAGGQKTVIDGPFSETKELVAGYWIWKVGSIEEALEWAKRCPSPMPGEESELELRPLYEAEDFAQK